MLKHTVAVAQPISDRLGTIKMSRPSIICAATIVWLSITAVDGANAKGTFRLEGAWPSSSAHNQTIENSERRLHRSGSARFSHALRGNREH